MRNLPIHNVRNATLAGVMAVFWCVAGPGDAAAAALVKPHRAVYELHLGARTADSTVTNARGKLEFEWNDVCDGWTISHRSRIALDHTTGRVDDFVWIFDSWEDKAGENYRFFVREAAGGRPVTETRGKAQLDPSGGGLAVYSLPEEREVPLPEGTVFPGFHTLLVMETAETGDFPLWRFVFDGNGDDGLFGISAVAMESFSAGTVPQPGAAILDSEKAWRFHLAIYGLDDRVAEPEQEQILRLFANGVADQLEFDYGDFTLDGRLSELEFLPDPGCQESDE
ncbi:MAG: DUF1849 family protein [Pseudomonadota bacterium]